MTKNLTYMVYQGLHQSSTHLSHIFHKVNIKAKTFESLNRFAFKKGSSWKYFLIGQVYEVTFDDGTAQYLPLPTADNKISFEVDDDLITIWRAKSHAQEKGRAVLAKAEKMRREGLRQQLVPIRAAMRSSSAEGQAAILAWVIKELMR